jgi:hypothetical protein
VNQLRRAERISPRVTSTIEPMVTAVKPSGPGHEIDGKNKKDDPQANVRRSQAKRQGFEYRPATLADEDELI